MHRIKVSRTKEKWKQNHCSRWLQVIKDGDEVYVEYGSGPRSFTARWEGRPQTPPFKWGENGVVLPDHDLWLTGVLLTGNRSHVFVILITYHNCYTWPILYLYYDCIPLLLLILYLLWFYYDFIPLVLMILYLYYDFIPLLLPLVLYLAQLGSHQALCGAAHPPFFTWQCVRCAVPHRLVGARDEWCRCYVLSE